MNLACFLSFVRNHCSYSKIIVRKVIDEMQIIALLRGVMPTGKNRIPKMSHLVELLSEAGFENVKTYIQSGNIILKTKLSHKETAAVIHKVIYDNLGADLSVIIKTKEQFQVALSENPFNDTYDYSRIHLVFTNDTIENGKLVLLNSTEFFDEIFKVGTECLYMYLPRDAERKKLNTNYLEKHLGIVATMRKINVIQHLCEY